ncbi:ABC transporter permease [Brevibacillus choshinensis]|uniref:FtsX-like permease family protein n=1 Tax=Brevibacillus choshinensis TaxID=54911 RepID=A0ABX7FRI9_BRECH|nr:ABC transporter permease [Brevibacillus choshinensis]QRG68309.1 FtsX-like permease family protein [Brevibacillus choshinensis]
MNERYFSPRLAKVLRDLWMYKGRSLLVVLTIAVGVSGVGVVGQAMVVLSRAMADTQHAVSPSQITLMTAPFSDEDMVEELLEIPNLSQAEALSYYRLRINVTDDGSGQPDAEAWTNFDLYALPDISQAQVGRITPEEDVNEWPPADGQLLLEHLAAQYLAVNVHDRVWIETPDSELHALAVDGTVRNPGMESATLSRVGSGFVSMNSLEDLGLPAGTNMIVLRVQGEGTDRKLLESVAASSRELLRDRGIEVKSTLIPEPGKHWASDIVMSMGSILQSLGALTLIAAAFLVVNTMLAILGSQLRQIGVMQVLGAEPNSLIRLYMIQAGIYGILALAVGLPIGYVGARALTGQSNYLLNFPSEGYSLSLGVMAMQVAIGIGLPLAAAYLPVWRGTRISVREALGGAGAKRGRHSRFDRFMEDIRGLPRPLLLSLRNTFRKKGRLLLTLVTLGLGGATVVSVFSVHASLMNTLDQTLQYADYDVRVTTAEPQAERELADIAMSAPGAVQTEQWGLIRAHRLYEDGSESAELTVHSLPADSGFIHPQLLSGEWLRPGEDDSIVLDSYLLRYFPELQVGDSIVLKIEGEKERKWHIKGFARKTIGEVVSYITKEGMGRAIGDDSQASLIHLRMGEHDSASQSAAQRELKERLKEEGFEVTSTEVTTEMRSIQEARMNIVVVFLSAMAVLLTLVSSLGLTGTMSLNVLERTREFGILRSIGATDGMVAGIVMAEGVLLGIIGWGAGCLLAVPVSYWLCQSVGLSLYQAPLDLVYSWTGVGYWLGTAVGLSALASLIPAWNAIRLPMQEILAYE